MYTGVVIPIGFRSVVFNLLLTLRISSESFRLESFRIAFLPLLFDLSQWHASTFAGSILTSSFDKTVKTFPSSSPSSVFAYISHKSFSKKLKFISNEIYIDVGYNDAI